MTKARTVAVVALGSGEHSGPIFDHMLATFNIDIPPSKFVKVWKRFQPYEQHLYATFLCYCEICNGGLDQFFWNQSGILAPEAVEGFRVMGLDRCANLVEEAMGFFGTPYPRSYRPRHKALRQLRKIGKEDESPFDKLDKRFFGLTTRKKIDGFRYAADKYALTILR